MKKIPIVGLGALITAGAAIPYLIHKKRQAKRQMASHQLPKTTSIAQPNLKVDFKDADHLIFCEESQLSRRLFQLETTLNMRDIGGYTGLDGRKTKWGKLIRSEELARLSASDIKALSDLNIKWIYDFRQKEKADRRPDPKIGNAINQNIDVLADFTAYLEPHEFTKPNGIDKFMRIVYLYQVKEKAETYAQILKKMTEEKNYPILYHCTNGKDRTGFFTALVLLICGVPEDVIISDYSLTNLTFDEAMETLGQDFADDATTDELPVTPEDIREFIGVKPAWLQLQLDYIRENYKDIDTYLLDNTSLTKEDLDEIRDQMLDAKSHNDIQ